MQEWQKTRCTKYNNLKKLYIFPHVKIRLIELKGKKVFIGLNAKLLGEMSLSLA